MSSGVALVSIILVIEQELAVPDSCPPDPKRDPVLAICLHLKETLKIALPHKEVIYTFKLT
jgi:hypothetical protein